MLDIDTQTGSWIRVDWIQYMSGWSPCWQQLVTHIQVYLLLPGSVIRWILFINNKNVDPSGLYPIYVWLVTMLVAAGYIHTNFSAATRIGDPSDFFKIRCGSGETGSINVRLVADGGSSKVYIQILSAAAAIGHSSDFCQMWIQESTHNGADPVVGYTDLRQK